jgi:hypothetical protein
VAPTGKGPEGLGAKVNDSLIDLAEEQGYGPGSAVDRAILAGLVGGVQDPPVVEAAVKSPPPESALRRAVRLDPPAATVQPVRPCDLDWSVGIKTVVPAAVSAMAAAAYMSVERHVDGSPTNPHAVMAASRVTVERIVLKAIQRLWAETTPTLDTRVLLVGAGPRQELDKLRPLVNLRVVGPVDGSNPDPYDSVRVVGGQAAAGGNLNEYWERVRNEIAALKWRDVAVFYNTGYYATPEVLAEMDRAANRGARIYGTLMKAPARTASKLLQPALFVPPYGASVAPSYFEGVVRREGDMMRVTLAGNATTYEHPVPDVRWSQIREDGAMFAAMWTPQATERADLPPNGVWFRLEGRELWTHTRIDPSGTTFESTVSACEGVLRGNMGARGLTAWLRPPALDEGSVVVVARFWAAALTPTMSWVTRARMSLAQLGSPLALSALVGRWPEHTATLIATAAAGSLGLPPLPSDSPHVVRLQALVALLFGVVLGWTPALALWAAVMLALTARDWGSLKRRPVSDGTRVALWLVALLAMLVARGLGDRGLVREVTVHYEDYAGHALARATARMWKQLHSALDLGTWVRAEIFAETCGPAGAHGCTRLVECGWLWCKVTEEYSREAHWWEYTHGLFTIPWWLRRISLAMVHPVVLYAYGMIVGVAGLLTVFSWPGIIAIPFVTAAMWRHAPMLTFVLNVCSLVLFKSYSRAIVEQFFVETSNWELLVALITQLVVMLILFRVEWRRTGSGATAAVPAYVPEVQPGLYEAVVGACKRSVWIGAKVEAQLDRGRAGLNRAVRAGAHVVLRAAGHLPPYFVYRHATGKAMLARYLVSAPAETPEALRYYTEFIDALFARMAPLTRNDLADFAAGHAREFMGAKRELYDSVAEHIRAGRLKWYAVRTMKALLSSFANGVAHKCGFTKTELSTIKDAKEVSTLARCGDEVEELYLATITRAKPRMVGFPTAVLGEGFEALSLVIATHAVVKRVFAQMFQNQWLLNSNTDLTTYADRLTARLRASGEVHGVQRSQLVAAARAAYYEAGHNDEIMVRAHPLGSTFCSKVLVPAVVRGEPGIAFTFPPHRLFARMLAIVGQPGPIAPSVLLEKLHNLASIAEPSALNARMVDIATRYVSRMTHVARAPVNQASWTEFTAQRGVASPVEWQHECTLWSTWYGADLARIFEELDLVDKLLGSVPIDMIYDPAFGDKCALRPVYVNEAECPVLHSWLLPGYEPPALVDPVASMQRLCDAALAGDLGAKQDVIKLARGETVNGVTWLDQAPKDRGSLKNLEMQKFVVARDPTVVIMIGAGRREFVDLVDDALEYADVIVVEVASKMDLYKDRYNVFSTPGEAVEWLLTEGSDRVLGRAGETQPGKIILWSDAPLAGRNLQGIDLAAINDAAGRLYEDEFTAYMTVEVLLKVSQEYAWEAAFTQPTGEAQFVVPLYAGPRSAEHYLLFDIARGPIKLNRVSELEAGASRVLAQRLRPSVRVVEPPAVTLSYDDQAGVDQQTYNAVASATGVGWLNDYAVVEIDAASCDGSHQHALYELQERLLKAVVQAMPGCDEAAARDLIYGPVVAETTLEKSKGWLASMKDRESSLASGLPWTTFANAGKFAATLERAAGAVNVHVTREQVLAALTMCGTGDDVLAFFRAVSRA